MIQKSYLSLKRASLLIPFCFLLSLFSMSAFAETEFKIITNNGFVGFTVGDDWPVISMQSKLPIAVATFQIPNLLDVGTDDSTNLGISIYDINTKSGLTAFNSAVKKFGADTPLKVEEYGQWTVYRQQAFQGQTRYTILDAKNTKIADVAVSVRIAWPHLTSDTEEYDSYMNSVFHTFLRSIHGGKGPYKPHPDEVIRRPIK